MSILVDFCHFLLISGNVGQYGNNLSSCSCSFLSSVQNLIISFSFLCTVQQNIHCLNCISIIQPLLPFCKNVPLYQIVLVNQMIELTGLFIRHYVKSMRRGRHYIDKFYHLRFSQPFALILKIYAQSFLSQVIILFICHFSQQRIYINYLFTV